MKTLIKLFSICILASIAFASCKSSTSITKRHYNKGYYVAHSKHLKTNPKVSENSFIVTANTPEQVHDVMVEKVLPTKTIESISPMPNTELVTANEAPKNKSTAFKNFKNAVHFKSVHLNHPSAEINKTNFESIPAGSGDDDDDGLSFFGFIVLLVIILWALGFFVGGLGGVIHLLLVIALVLLILWLLRII